MPTTDRDELKVTVLLHEHSMVRNESILMLGHYKNHTRVLQIVATAVLALIYWYVTAPVNTRIAVDVNPLAWRVALGVAILMPVLCAYLVFDVLHSLYALNLLGTRTSKLEVQVAEIVGPHLMIWERISTKFFSEPLPAGVWNPAYFHSGLAALVALSLMGVFPGLIYDVLWSSPVRVTIAYAEMWFLFGITTCVIVVGACFAYYWEVMRNMRRKAEHWLNDALLVDSKSVATPSVVPTKRPTRRGGQPKRQVSAEQGDPNHYDAI